MQRESLIASQTPSTPTTSTPTTKPPTTTPTPSGTSQPRTQITPTTPTISTPITPAPPQPPAPAVKYDDCPTAPSMDAGLTAYIDGVNNKKKNYSPDCHTWYLTYAKSKNDAAIGAYVTGIINGCQNEGGRWVNNACDYSVRNYLNYARWKADACFATNQAYDAPNDRCVPLPATRQFQYTCTLIGQEEISIPKRGKIWADKTISFSIFATTGGKAMDICVQFRSGLNRQDKYKEFYVPIPGGLIKN
jgi:hypothetical protein